MKPLLNGVLRNIERSGENKTRLTNDRICFFHKLADIKRNL